MGLSYFFNHLLKGRKRQCYLPYYSLLFAKNEREFVCSVRQEIITRKAATTPQRSPQTCFLKKKIEYDGLLLLENKKDFPTSLLTSELQPLFISEKGLDNIIKKKHFFLDSQCCLKAMTFRLTERQ